MTPRTKYAFLALVILQAAHSIEEYVFALYDVFVPARILTGLVSDDRAVGFIIVNAAFVAFGIWVYVARVQPGRATATAWMWPWVLVEIANGIVHPAMAIQRGEYFPGVLTAPALGALAVVVGWDLFATGSAETAT